MKVEARIFEVVMAFCFIAGIVYTVLAAEPVGVACLFLTGGLALIIGGYFRFVARRMEERPEDRDDAEVSDGAGVVGFFSPGSYWPITLAGAAAITAIALALWQVWLLVIGLVVLLAAVAGLVFEYHIGPAGH